MNDLQKKQFELLKEFIRVCEKYNLKYFLVGGTALGAARHQGFIPWDDDVDVGMPREDYEKYILLQKEYEGTPYFIQTWRTDPHYQYNFAKLRDSSTTYIENYFKWHRMNHGVWIDIFPIDGFSKKDTFSPKKFRFKNIHIWAQVYISWFPQLRRKFKKGTRIKDFFLNVIAILTYPLDIAHYRRRHCDRIMKNVKWEDAKLVGNWCGNKPSKEAMPKDIYEEFTTLPFEGIQAKVVKDYDRYLTLLFGDWHKLPPEKQQVGHHINSGFSLTQGYEDYIREHKI